MSCSTLPSLQKAIDSLQMLPAQPVVKDLPDTAPRQAQKKETRQGFLRPQRNRPCQSAIEAQTAYAGSEAFLPQINWRVDEFFVRGKRQRWTRQRGQASSGDQQRRA